MKPFPSALPPNRDRASRSIPSFRSDASFVIASLFADAGGHNPSMRRIARLRDRHGTRGDAAAAHSVEYTPDMRRLTSQSSGELPP